MKVDQKRTTTARVNAAIDKPSPSTTIVKIHLLSDLHLTESPFVPPATDAEVVILAGDVTDGVAGIAWARQAFPHQEIVYVCGNHEFYGGDWEGILAACHQGAAAHEVHFLENSKVEINGVRFLGCTLWTDFDLKGENYRGLATQICAEAMRDFSVIGDGPVRLRPTQSRLRHRASRVWLETQLAKPFSGPTVVVTHHLPSARSLNSVFKNEWTSCAYASHLDGLLGTSVLWVHGHVHHSNDYVVDGTRVMSNPRGYTAGINPTRGNRRFDPGLVVEV